ncbi:MAG: nicotinate phosphoribosyltransferase [Oscillospiraceae bacterium]|nr:nicotinate phosphoribosyltransferase [Oscillospiraceae bacterium]
MHNDIFNKTVFDFCELFMAGSCYPVQGNDTEACFEVYCNNAGENGGFFIFAGLNRLIENISRLNFSDGDICYFRELGLDPAFLDYLKNFRLNLDIWSVPEGTPVFPGEPVIKIWGPAAQAQLAETLILLPISYQTGVATKANRLVRAAGGRQIIETGAKRAPGGEAALCGARAAFIGGASATTCVNAAREYNIPYTAGMNSGFVQLFDNEREAFAAFARKNPENCVLILDTYDTLKSGLENAIDVFNAELIPRGFRPKGVRIDSGDLAYLSKKIRRRLNDAGFPDCAVIASNALDEYIIKDMLLHGARVDSFMAGRKLVSPSQNCNFSYKITAVKKDDAVTPKIKLSGNVAKNTAPCAKLLWRLFDRETGKAIADLLTLEDETVDESVPYQLFDPDFTWKRKTAENFIARQLLKPVFKNGELAAAPPGLADIRAYCLQQVDSLWEEVLRFEYPHDYYVDYSQRLWDERTKLIHHLQCALDDG